MRLYDIVVVLSPELKPVATTASPTPAATS